MDGGWIAFDRVSKNGIGVTIIRPSGTGRRRITDTGHEPSWSPGGHRLAYVLRSSSGPEEYVCSVRRDGTHNRRVTHETNTDIVESPTWSPRWFMDRVHRLVAESSWVRPLHRQPERETAGALHVHATRAGRHTGLASDLAGEASTRICPVAI
jgi:hypothetical protein